jgi:hypothetical protein
MGVAGRVIGRTGSQVARLAPNQAMQLTASKLRIHLLRVAIHVLRAGESCFGLAAADLVSR